MGLIFLGDSATAHFSVPVRAALGDFVRRLRGAHIAGSRSCAWSGPDQPHYLNASAINNSTYDQLLFIASNELDWPQQSGSTGFVEVAHKDCPGMLKEQIALCRTRALAF